MLRLFILKSTPLLFKKKKRKKKRKTQGLTLLLTLNLNFIYSLLFASLSHTHTHTQTREERERESAKTELAERKMERSPLQRPVEIIHSPPLVLLPTSKCMRTRLDQICLSIFVFLLLPFLF